MAQIDVIKANSDPFYGEDNINELRRRVADLKTGKSTLKEHDLIPEPAVNRKSEKDKMQKVTPSPVKD